MIYYTISFTNTYPPVNNQPYRINASINGFAPAFLNFSILVSAPNAVIAIVNKMYPHC